jgi:hypothetical protein
MRNNRACQLTHSALPDGINGDSAKFITHAELLLLAKRKRCLGIVVTPERKFCDALTSRWVFKAIVFPKLRSQGFVGYGDADPSNVAPEFHGCELRIAETRAVNRALRKAYGIGLCSLEELSSPPPTPSNGAAPKPPKRTPPLEVVAPVPLRDQLRQLIRQHKLDPAKVKQYALEHCAVQSLRQATREQVAGFVQLLNERVTTDRESLLADLQRFPVNEVRTSKEAA